jgi:hypothetical protein
MVGIFFDEKIEQRVGALILMNYGKLNGVENTRVICSRISCRTVVGKKNNKKDREHNFLQKNLLFLNLIIWSII